ncbi:hypothetical protein F2Q69_00022973 [Brassica cretica]|uniref:Uncharacterized protein n=1 Tax=Brassica cretica TaxID=69181 RepID=A0A8S9QC57_BRACR|nr:hypothetical protein F2Q69_00022973 [Brassica cretica]
MVATLILVRDEMGDLHDQEGHMCNAAGLKIYAQGAAIPEGRRRYVNFISGTGFQGSGNQGGNRNSYGNRANFNQDDDFWQEVKHEKLQEGDFEVESSPEHRSTTPTESTVSCNAVRIMTHKEFTAKHPHPPSPGYLKIYQHSDPVIDRHKETSIDRQPPAPIDRRAPLTYRVQMPKIDVARLNALKPKPKPSDNPPKTIRIPSDDAADPMEVDRVPMGRTLRKI